MIVNIYTDGGADPNPGIGGWAAILQAGNREKVISGNDPQSTNNRMELTAAIEALRALNKPSQVAIHTDSEYVRKGITEWIERWAASNWKRKGKPVANAGLWQELWSLAKQHQIEWHWVKGHSGNTLNERVDKLARMARLEITPVEEIPADAHRLFVRASCKGNPGPGGWGVVLERGDETEQMSGSESRTTNNRMEITAVIEGLRMIPAESTVWIFTTSDYVFQGASKWIHGWRRRDWKKRDGKQISNLMLWKELDQQMTRHQIKWINAKGSSENAGIGLEEAAKLAKAAIDTEL